MLTGLFFLQEIQVESVPMNEDGSIVTVSSAASSQAQTFDSRIDVTTAPVTITTQAFTQGGAAMEVVDEMEGNTNPHHPASEGPLAQMDSNNGDMCCEDDDMVASDARQVCYQPSQAFSTHDASVSAAADATAQLAELQNVTFDDKLAQHCRDELLRHQTQEMQQSHAMPAYCNKYDAPYHSKHQMHVPGHRKEAPIPCPRYPPMSFMDSHSDPRIAQRRSAMKHARSFGTSPPTPAKVNQHEIQSLCQEARSLYNAYAADCAAQNMPWPLPFSPFPYDDYLNKQAQLYEAQGRPYSGGGMSNDAYTQPYFRDDGG